MEIELDVPPKLKYEYTELLDCLKSNFDILRLRDHELVEDSQKVCFLRHDIDLEMGFAIKLAKIEHDAGIHSSFFVLHTMPYFYQDGFIESCKEIQSLGHEIGLHNSVLSECIIKKNMTEADWNTKLDSFTVYNCGKKIEYNIPNSCILYEHNFMLKDVLKPEETLTRYLKVLRDNGLDIIGSSAHGNNYCKDLHFQHYHIFKECDRHYYPETASEVEGFKLHTKPLKHYGLEYEAYFLDREYLLCDWQTGWWCYPKGYDEWCESELIGQFVRDPLVFLDSIGKRDGDFIMQLNTHPLWWFVDLNEIVKERG